MKSDDISKIKDAINSPSNDTGGGALDVYLTILGDLFDITRKCALSKVERISPIGVFIVESGIVFYGINFKEVSPLDRLHGVKADFFGEKIQVGNLLETFEVPLRFKKINQYNVEVIAKVAVYESSEFKANLISFIDLMDSEDFLARTLKYPIKNGTPVMEWSFMEIPVDTKKTCPPPTTPQGRQFVEALTQYLL